MTAYLYSIGYDSPPAGARLDRQSGLGVACFVLSILPAAGSIAMSVVVWSVQLNGGATPPALQGVAAVPVLLCFGWFLGGLMLLVSVGLGIAGIVQPARARHLAAWGLALDGLAVVSWSLTVAAAS